MSQDYDCMLTLALPAALEETMLDLLRAVPERVRGFSTIAAQGFGAGATMHSAVEQVRGRADRRLVLLLMLRTDVEPLLEALRARLQTDDVAWWISPVSAFGRLG